MQRCELQRASVFAHHHYRPPGDLQCCIYNDASVVMSFVTSQVAAFIGLYVIVSHSHKSFCHFAVLSFRCSVVLPFCHSTILSLYRSVVPSFYHSVECPSNFRPMFVQLPSNIHPTFVRRPSPFRSTFVIVPCKIRCRSMQSMSLFLSKSVTVPFKVRCHPSIW